MVETDREGEWLVRSYPASLEEVVGARRMVAERAGLLGFAVDRVGEIELAVEEALVNICRHAFTSGRGEYGIRVLAENRLLTVVIEDEGVPFDPLSVAPPDLDSPLEERPIGGLGIHLMRRVTSALRYERRDGRNCLTLVFEE